MSNLQDKFNAVMAKIDDKITDKKELEFIKEQITTISMLYIDELNRIMDLSERRVNQVYENQKSLQIKMDKIEKSMNTIEKELFVEDDYDFEIVCPYCNYEFLTDINSSKKEVQCPECHNTIELDWNAEENEYTCGGHCDGCTGCIEEDIIENDDEDDM